MVRFGLVYSIPFSNKDNSQIHILMPPETGGWSKAKMGWVLQVGPWIKCCLPPTSEMWKQFEIAPPTYHLQWPALWITPHMIYLTSITHHHTSNRSNTMHWLMETKSKCQQRNHAMTSTPVMKMWLSVFISGKKHHVFPTEQSFQSPRSIFKQLMT